MAKVTIKVNDNGSLRITGDVELVDAEEINLKQSQASLFAAAVCLPKNLFVTEAIKEIFLPWYEHRKKKRNKIVFLRSYSSINCTSTIVDCLKQ